MSDSGLTNRLRQRSCRAGLAVGLSMALTLGLCIGSFIVFYVRLEPLTRDFVGANVPDQAAATLRYARITVRAAECPSADVVSQCDDQPLAGIDFLVAGAWRTTDEDGEVAWAPGAGAHRLVAQESSYAASYVSCADQVAGDLVFEGIAADGNRVDITTTAGQPVICDWYFLTEPPET